MALEILESLLVTWFVAMSVIIFIVCAVQSARKKSFPDRVVLILGIIQGVVALVPVTMYFTLSSETNGVGEVWSTMAWSVSITVTTTSVLSVAALVLGLAVGWCISEFANDLVEAQNKAS